MAVHIKNEFGFNAKNANQQQAINGLHISSAKIVLHFSRTVGPFANATLKSYYLPNHHQLITFIHLWVL